MTPLSRSPTHARRLGAAAALALLGATLLATSLAGVALAAPQDGTQDPPPKPVPAERGDEKPDVPVQPDQPVKPIKPAEPAKTADGDAAATPVPDVSKMTPAEREKALRAALADLSKRLGKVKTLKARFEQKKYLAVFEREVTSMGSLALEPPTRLRWEYEHPIKSVLIVDGERARTERTSRRGKRTVRTFALSEDRITAITADQVFLWTRGEFAKAEESYKLDLVSLMPLELKATPRDERMRKVVRSVTLTFTKDRNALAQVALDESDEARTRIAFTDVEIDPELPATLFKLEDSKPDDED